MCWQIITLNTPVILAYIYDYVSGTQSGDKISGYSRYNNNGGLGVSSGGYEHNLDRVRSNHRIDNRMSFNILIQIADCLETFATVGEVASVIS